MPQACTNRRLAPIVWAVLTCWGFFFPAPSSFALAADAAPNTTAPPAGPAPSQPAKQTGEPILVPAQYQASQEDAGQPGNSPLNVSTIQDGDSSDAARQRAERAIPLLHMTPDARRQVQEIIKHHSLFRRLPTISFEVRPDVYQFYATRPDVAVSIWRVLKISQFQMWQTGPNTYEVDSGDGSFGSLNVLYRGRDNKVIVCNGQYSTPLLVKPIQAGILMHLQTTHGQNAQGKTTVTHHADIFVTFPSHTVETAAKIIAPISNTIADRNFREVSLFVQMMSMLMESQPNWVERVVDQMDGVLKVRKTEMLRLTAETYMAARQQEMGRAIDEHSASIHKIINPPPAPASAGNETSTQTLDGRSIRVERLAAAPEETTGRARVVLPPAPAPAAAPMER